MCYDAEGNPLAHNLFQYKADAETWASSVPGSVDAEYEQEAEPAPAHYAFATLRNQLINIKRHCQDYSGSGVAVLLSGEDNFRYEIATIKEYKANRKYKKPILLPECRQYLIDHHGALVIDGHEADDEASIIAYRRRQEGHPDDVIVHIDKDLDMIPGLHFNFVREDFYEVNDLTALQWFYQQLLMGDAGDNIPGCAGVGKSSKKLDVIQEMTDELEMYDYVLATYEGSYGNRHCTYAEIPAEDVVVENARLLWMQQWPGQLWVPPTRIDAHGNRLWDRYGEF